MRIKRIGPEWYRGVRRHGLIMGCSVTGVKPKVCGASRVHHSIQTSHEFGWAHATCGAMHAALLCTEVVC